MIQKGTYLKVLDNTGVKSVTCITSGQTSGRGKLRIGSILLTVVRERQSQSSQLQKKKAEASGGKAGSTQSAKDLKRGEKVFAVLVQTLEPETRTDGSKIQYGQNGVVLLRFPPQSKGSQVDSRRPDSLSGATPLGTRVLDPISISLRHRLPGLGVKLLSMTKRVS
jgi:ribosomal protein L14